MEAGSKFGLSLLKQRDEAACHEHVHSRLAVKRVAPSEPVNAAARGKTRGFSVVLTGGVMKPLAISTFMGGLQLWGWRPVSLQEGCNDRLVSPAACTNHMD